MKSSNENNKPQWVVLESFKHDEGRWNVVVQVMTNNLGRYDIKIGKHIPKGEDEELLFVPGVSVPLDGMKSFTAPVTLAESITEILERLIIDAEICILRHANNNRQKWVDHLVELDAARANRYKSTKKPMREGKTARDKNKGWKAS